jgi:hypothetical protein
MVVARTALCSMRLAVVLLARGRRRAEGEVPHVKIIIETELYHARHFAAARNDAKSEINIIIEN